MQLEPERDVSPPQPMDDWLDTIEPVPVPRRRLQLIIFLSLLSLMHVVIPVPLAFWGGQAHKSLLEILWEVPTFGAQALILYLFLLGPATGLVLSVVMARGLLATANTSFVPRGTGLLIPLTMTPAVLWLIPVTLALFFHVLPTRFDLLVTTIRSADPMAIEVLAHTILFLLLWGGPLAACIALFLARLGPGRSVLAIVAAQAHFIGWCLFISASPGMMFFRLPPLFMLCPALTAVSLGLGLSCVRVYREQRRRERQFQEAMRERDQAITS